MLTPEAFLQLAAHPLRWRLLGDLTRSDRTVQELTVLVDQPQNLVSYHLGKLRDANLVVARRSSADRRDAYYHVDLERLGNALTATGAALHPAFGGAPAPFHPRRGKAAPRVLFLCTGNSARSQMAEALVRVRSGGLVSAFSGGSHPKPIHPHAVTVMRDDYRIDISAQRSKNLRTFARRRFEHVVTLCDRVREVCPEFPGAPETAHWSIADPAAGRDDAASSYEAFRQTAAELDTRIRFFLVALATPAN
jgi:ArsR family transcriptional regulator, arsenate/arsenite/antimonite-responsive transcriptional repressor / arsenate reductase (thioredoxin)